MTQSDTTKRATGNGASNGAHGAAQASSKQVRKSATKATQVRKRRINKKPVSDVPSWLGIVISAVGVSVAVGAGIYATRHQWMPKANAWKDDFSAAFADDETDYENFDQTRHAGAESMRDDPGADWSDVDDMSDASFPASDPPSFNPGTAG